MEPNGYTFTRADVERLFIGKHFPERTTWEDRILLDYLMAHAHEFDRYTFSRRIGHGTPPNPDHLPGVQRNTVFSSQKRIDLLAWTGARPTIVEVKRRVTPASLGQILTYRSLLLQENPDVGDPALVVIGETSDPDTIGVLNAHGIAVYLYPQADAAGADAIGPARALGGAAP